jgi:ketosteroid isomerase-like protein
MGFLLSRKDDFCLIMKKYVFLVSFVLLSFKSFSQEEHIEIDQFIDAWHLAAAKANANVFFGSMDDDCIYIGTDATERWTKTEFETFAKPYFDKGKAWDFKPYNRDLHVPNEGDYVWFSELLETWMGVCRGSGIIKKTPNGWKIKQYHLSVTVPNGIIQDFISLVKASDKKQTPKN